MKTRGHGFQIGFALLCMGAAAGFLLLTPLGRPPVAVGDHISKVAKENILCVHAEKPLPAELFFVRIQPTACSVYLLRYRNILWVLDSDVMCWVVIVDSEGKVLAVEQGRT